MKQALLKQLEALVKNLMADGYGVTVNVDPFRGNLLINIKLKSDNDKQILSEWNKARRTGG